MAGYRYRAGDLPPAIVTAHDESAHALAWATINDDQRRGIKDLALPASFTKPDGTVLFADIEKRREQ